MKGKLIRKDKEWFVDAGRLVCFPVFPNDIHYEMVDGSNVDFEERLVCPNYYGSHIGKDCSCKSGFVTYAKLIEPENEIKLFNSKTTNHEVFSIKSDGNGNMVAYIGYKTPNGNFNFEMIPYTEKESPL
jgi:hypothetical protein